MEAVRQEKDPTRPLLWALLILSAVGIVVTIAMVVLQYSIDKTINNFQDCKIAGGVIAESYPEQCFIDDRSFVNDMQQVAGADDYIGLTEQAALDKADQQGVPGRIVERDGEPLSVTLDYAPGRLNMYVKDGEVYRVVVEGE